MRFVLCRAVFREGHTMFTIRLAGGLHLAPLDEDKEEKVATPHNKGKERENVGCPAGGGCATGRVES